MYGLQVLGAFEKLETLLKDSVFLTDHIGLQGILNYKTETALKT